MHLKKDMFMRMQRGGMDPSKGQDKGNKKPNRTVSNLNCCSPICSSLKYFSPTPNLIASG